MQRYNPKDIEPKWQKYWDDNQTYKANLASDKPKYIAMSMFNYPSGAGIHIGHAMNYTISDVLARFKRQQGYESYHPVGWDSFGLPAENYAIKAGVSPQQSMATIIPNYHKQYKAMGWSNDWSKEIATHTPEYYKWTQWIFSEMYRAGLAYQDSRMQWWCDKCQTVLANEQVIDDKCWRHDSADDPEVTQREVKQWFFKITDYADELLEAIDDLDWTESVKLAQKNWIGKSVGAEVNFDIDESDQKVTVFTTRPDTLFGATFLVLAPEHELVKQITTLEQKTEVEAYVKDSLKKTDVERQAGKQKTGVFTGAYAVNPVNQEKIPVWIADYVLMGYGTGAIMAVPAHDERDNEFANKYGLDIKLVVARLHIDQEHSVKQGLPFEERLVAQVIVKHPNEEKYLRLKLKGWDQETYSLPIGGVDEGEEISVAASRELIEETGFTDHDELKPVSSAYVAEFYHGLKKVNRRATIHNFFTQLRSLKQSDLSDEEKAKHDLEWVSLDDLYESLHGQGSQQVILDFKEAKSVLDDEGVMINSGHYDGQNSSKARESIVQDLAKQGVAQEKVNFRMRDWSVSRQRYWGAPIPIIHCADCGPQLVPDSQLPVVLPELKDFAPSGDGRSALARATDWLKASCPKCGKDGERETDTLDTYICSSWYMLRYFDPTNKDKIFDSAVVNKWMPIDFYNGADHATAHMIYARFVTRFFSKKGLLDNPEPFKKFLFNGKVTAQDGQMFSKSKGNGVDPLEIINQGYGADALRTYLMFAAPLELWVRWDPQGVPGAHRFLSRIWGLVTEFNEADGKQEAEQLQLLPLTHRAIQKVSGDLEQQKYNTAVASLMALTNDLYKAKTAGFTDKKSWQEALDSLVMMVAPFAPHIAEELWRMLGHDDSVHVDHWPVHNPELLKQNMATVAVQVNGKLRATVQVPAGANRDDAVNAAKAEENVAKHLDGKEPKKVIFIPDRLINFVV